MKKKKKREKYQRQTNPTRVGARAARTRDKQRICRAIKICTRSRERGVCRESFPIFRRARARDIAARRGRLCIIGTREKKAHSRPYAPRRPIRSRRKIVARRDSYILFARNLSLHVFPFYSLHAYYWHVFPLALSRLPIERARALASRYR